MIWHVLKQIETNKAFPIYKECHFEHEQVFQDVGSMIFVWRPAHNLLMNTSWPCIVSSSVAYSYFVLLFVRQSLFLVLSCQSPTEIMHCSFPNELLVLELCSLPVWPYSIVLVADFSYFSSMNKKSTSELSNRVVGLNLYSWTVGRLNICIWFSQACHACCYVTVGSYVVHAHQGNIPVHANGRVV